MQQLVFFLVIMTATMISFQNCGKSSFPGVDNSTDATASSREVNGFNLGARGEGFHCVPGRRLAVWLDPDNSGIVQSENYLGFVVSYSGSEDAASNYNYFSASAHPIVGPTPLGFETNIFFYEGSDGLSLNMFSNIDNGGSSDNIVDIDITVSGNLEADSVILSDDRAELKQVTSGDGSTGYEGRFHYWVNTDGGVIGPFQGDDYKIHVRFLSTGDIQNARFHSANDNSFLLANQPQSISSFIITFESIEECN